MLSGLYMGRSDTQLVVRQASLHVWKIVVSNTPRTLREILPTLFTLLLGFLASTFPDKRTVHTQDYIFVIVYNDGTCSFWLKNVKLYLVHFTNISILMKVL